VEKGRKEEKVRRAGGKW